MEKLAKNLFLILALTFILMFVAACNQDEPDSNESCHHTLETLPEVEATCTSPGKTEGSKCTKCGEILVEQHDTSIIPHSYDETTDTCVCGAKKNYTEGLEFTLINDGTEYEVSGIGTANNEVWIDIPKTYNGLPVTSIGRSAFGNNDRIVDVVIPKSVTHIDDNAFWRCSGLRSVTIPNSIAHIGLEAFYCCYSIERITVEQGNTRYHSEGNCLIETASNTLVLGCKNSIIPTDGSVTSIGDYAFAGCSGLTSITIPNSVTSIGFWAFVDCTGLTVITIPDSISSIDVDAFAGCWKLVEVYDLSPHITVTKGSGENGNIGLYALDVFTDANAQSNLINENGYILYDNGTDRYLMGYIGSDTDLTLPDNINGKSYSMMYDYAFYRNTKITSVKMPSNVINISKYAFAGCDALKDITIGNGVTSIDERAFYECDELDIITISDSVMNIGENAFKDCISINEVHISSIASWCNIDFDGPDSCPISGNLYLNGELVTELVIPEGVESIGAYAFYSCQQLLSVTIPEGVKNIGDYSFYNCQKFASITIPEGVERIGDYAFSICNGLTNIEIPRSVTSIGEYAFSHCAKLTSVTLGNGITSVGDHMFAYNYALTSITISNSIQNIHGSAFDGCNALNDINYKGTREEWYKISIIQWGNYKIYGIHCDDGDALY